MFISRFLFTFGREQPERAKKADNRNTLAEMSDLTVLGARYGNSLGQIHDQGAGSNPAGK
jgi:hypothetical protein